MLLLMPHQRATREEEIAALVARSYEDVLYEDDLLLRPTSGSIPEAIRGVYYRNGPGRFTIGNQRYKHPFDGEGMIARFEFGEGYVHFRNRFVRTRESQEEREAGKMLYRSFGTQLPGGVLKNALSMDFKNAANTSVIYHGGKLLALWEGGVPHELDPVTLETRGRHDFRGALQNDFSWFEHKINPELPFSAHPKVDPVTGDLYNFGLAHGLESRLMLYHVGDDGEMRERVALERDALPFAHDFGLTDRWRVFFLPPVHFELGKALAGLEPPVESLRHIPESPMTLALIDREAPSNLLEFEVPPGFIFHLVNTWEEGDMVYADALWMESLPPSDFWGSLLEGRPIRDTPLPKLVRYRVDLGSNEVHCWQLARGDYEFPSTNQPGKRHDRAWFVSSSPARESSVLSALSVWDNHLGTMQYRDLFPDLPGEPVYVEDPTGEGPGWLLSIVYRADRHTSDLRIFDASDLQEVARVEVPFHLGAGFHGCWCPSPLEDHLTETSPPSANARGVGV